METSYQVFLIIFATSIIQSIFGVGLLVFGTPLLLLIGLDFSRVLSILLPCSIFLSAIQAIKEKEHINWEVVRKVLFVSLPLIIVFLLISLSFKNNFNFSKIMGSILVIVASLSYFKVEIVNRFKVKKSDYLYFVFLGIIHGLSNLGGSLLSIYVKNQCKSKKAIRGTIAINYLFFAVIQLIVLVLTRNFVASTSDWLNIFIVLFTMFLIGNWIFIKFSETFYSKVLNILILLIGIYFLLR